ncbi:MAG TPA: N-acetylmuramoyl-L-alanine amidase [Candidatus Mediterraneibacter guildfordensis]|nr:N-acetylmuramoyl-L-alanine amidase [Candidatus Mediterraneibacter guildfordensis]
MASKVKSAAMLLGLAGLIVLCHMAGMKLESRMKEETRETFKLSKEMQVILDAGHGGIDVGKTGVNGEKEKDINLEISKKIKKFLSDSNVTVKMTREGDERLADSQREDLKARTDIMNGGALLAVSIHQNSYRDPAVSGAQVFYYTDSEEGRTAAGMIQAELNALAPDNEKEIRANDSYYILKNTRIPTVIVECGFLSSYTEAEKLADDEYQNRIAEAVSEGILQYITD